MSTTIEIYALRCDIIQCEECGYPLLGKNTREVHDFFVKEHGKHPHSDQMGTCLPCALSLVAAIRADVAEMAVSLPPHR